MTLYDLLPDIYRHRDGDRGRALKAYLELIDEVLDETAADIDRLYDDWFIETCAEWVVPYIGDLLDAPRLRPIPAPGASLRSYVANTIAYRRRKGTAAVLEQLAFDITWWRARAVEYFELLAVTQHLNHKRPRRGETINLRDSDAIERLRTERGDSDPHQGAFDTSARSADVRSIASGRGTHNIPNLGLWLYRLNPYPLVVPIVPDRSGPNRYRMSQLGIDVPLFNVPQTEESIDSIAQEANVPGPIRLSALKSDLKRVSEGGDPRFYGQVSSPEGPRPRAIEIFHGVSPVEADVVGAADLDEWDIPDWDPAARDSKIVVDPTTSRLMLPDRLDWRSVRVRSAYAAAADIGGGPYDRTVSRSVSPGDWFESIIAASPLADAEHLATIDAALQDWAGEVPPHGRLEIADSDSYRVGRAIEFSVSQRLVIGAAEGQRPQLIPAGQERELLVRGAEGASLELRGLLVAGAINIQGPITVLIQDCTLIPGLSIYGAARPWRPRSPSIEVFGDADVELSLERTICGPIYMPSSPARVEEAAPLRISDSVVQQPHSDRTLPAVAAAKDSDQPGAEAAIERSTILGRMHVSELYATDSIFTDRVQVDRTQSGCIRFSFVAAEGLGGESTTPRRYRCEPDLSIAAAIDAARTAASWRRADLDEAQVAALEAQVAALERRIRRRVKPGFVSTRYGEPAYVQLTDSTSSTIRAGGEDGIEMGALAMVMAPIRLENLRRALDHYTRYGTEVGILHQT